MKIRNNVLELIQGDLSHTLNVIKHVDNVPFHMVILYRPVPQLHMNASTAKHNGHLYKKIAMLNKKKFLLVEICHGHQLYNIVCAFQDNAFRTYVPLPIVIMHSINKGILNFQSMIAIPNKKLFF
jgi:hypothetical protein